MSVDNTPNTDTPPATPDFLADSLSSIPDASGNPAKTANAMDVDFLQTIASEIDSAAPEKEEPKTDVAKPKDKPVEKTEEQKLDDDGFPENPPGKVSAEAKKGWGELKSEVRTVKQERDQLLAKVKELEEKSTRLPELEEKAKLADEAEKELSISRIEATQEFKKVVTAPLEAIGTAIEEVAKENELDQEALEDAITEPDTSKRNKKLDALLAGVPDAAKYNIYQMAKDTQTILRRRDDMHSKASEVRKELDSRQLEEQTKTKAEQKRTMDAAIKRTSDTLKERIPFEPLAEGETADAVFADIANKALASDYTAATPDVQAYSVYAGLILPRIIKQYHANAAAKKTAEARVAELTAAGPSANASNTSRQAPATGIDFIDNVMQDLGIK